MTSSLPNDSAPQERRYNVPSPPIFQSPQRAAVVLDRDPSLSWQNGWAVLDGGWLHFLPDDYPHWLTVGPAGVFQISWQVEPYAAF